MTSTVARRSAPDAIIRPSKIPAPLRFPLVATLSLTISALLYSATATYTSGELARVSRRLERWDEVALLVGWRTVELALGWFGGYDGMDLGSLVVLGHGPTVSCFVFWRRERGRRLMIVAIPAPYLLRSEHNGCDAELGY